MRIAYLINQYPKVSHSFIRREILALEREGFEITRLAIRGWKEDLVDPEDQSERENTRYVLRENPVALLLSLGRALLTEPVRLWRALALTLRTAHRADRSLFIHLAYLAEACIILRWLRTENIQHIHAHFGTNSATVAMFMHALGGPRWSFTVHGPEEFDRGRLIDLAEKVKRCTFVVTISSFGRSQLYRFADHQDWSKIQVVHCGLERRFHSIVPRLPIATRRLVCVGRLCEQKGQLLLVDAARRLAKLGTEFELVLAGDGELRTEIENLIAQHELQAKIRVLGWISSAQVRDEILAARALVLPSFAEGLPVVIMEAMALRRPVISTFVAGIPELVQQGKHGWLVPAGDVQALTEAMRACLDSSPDTLKSMGDAAYQRVSDRHDVETETQKLAKLFRTGACLTNFSSQETS